ncbi:scavenger receptor cysteine-rich domain-containing group B protein [Amia ocellicauda]|uniref:scavenger receptor cysteine-rich domain-containing group B protein n=1 Tax=Amia ocellicauda TaxID=2972642 RepID=UPI003463D586
MHKQLAMMLLFVVFGVLCANAVSASNWVGHVRLVNGSDACNGRIEVLHNSQWGTVCDDQWDIRDAEVVCRELDCGAPILAVGTAYFGQGTGQIWLDDVVCSGDEVSLMSCSSHEPGVHNCGHLEDAGVICAGSGRVRLEGGKDICSGRVEVLHNKQWGTVCDDGWDMMDAGVVCRELGCGAPLAAPGFAHFGQGTGPIWMDDVLCPASQSSLIACPSGGFGVHNCNHGEDASVVCDVSSLSREVGSRTGSLYSSSGPHVYGHVTSLIVWELSSSYITGFQIKYGKRWTPIYGVSSGQFQTFNLYLNEFIIQVSGKYSSYINQLSFVTNMGRTFRMGQPSGQSFDFSPIYRGAELRYIQGRFNSVGITSIGVQWDRVLSGFTKYFEEGLQRSVNFTVKNETENNSLP